HPLANFQGGDISGIHKKLEDGYFSDLGINTLWISPIIQNAEGGYTEFIPPHRKFTGYHGYWPTHPRNVDDRFTTKEELISFISTAHEQDMKILMDFVSNHTHENHPYFKDHRDWYGQVELPDGTMNIRNWSGETMLTTWFDTFLPSFDYVSNPDAIDQVVSDAVFWLGEYKFDGFRQDATKHVPHSFWKELTKQVKYNFTEREIFQIGESFGSNALIGEYVNPGELNSQFNFELYFEGRWQFSGHPDFVKLNRTVSSNMDFFQPMNTMGTITSSHDQVRFMGFADGQLNFEENGTERGFSNPPISVKNSSSYDKLFMFTVFNMCLPGIPVVYYGEEIGQIGANDPDNRRMMRFDDQLTTDEQIHFQKMSQLIKLRRNFPALSIGDLVVIYEDKNLSCWLKIYFEERVLVIFNNSSNTQEVTLDFSTEIHRAVSLLDRSFVDVESGIFMTNVDAYETKLYQLMK
ncbi:MAG: alpha-amylase family glycosyl hydrolase, partial [Fidelibacterota bacterium]